MKTSVLRSQYSDLATPTCALAMTCFRHCAGFWTRKRRNLLSFILSLILVVPLFAQMDASNADPGTSFFDTRPRQYLFGDWPVGW
jgi:hypothetical protein